MYLTSYVEIKKFSIIFGGFNQHFFLSQYLLQGEMSRLTHVQGVRLLYKSCLKLHRGLPLELQAIGDSYVKEEFRRHKTATPEHTQVFMQQWAVSRIFL